MKKIVVFILILGLMSTVNTYGQLVPVFIQKLSDGVLLDPSLAGYSGGSAVFGIQRQWSQVNGSPQYMYMGAHTRFGQDKMGIGVNVFLEESNILENYYVSVPAAYHLPINKNSGISFGLAPELTRNQLNTDKIVVRDYDDPVIMNMDDRIHLDFSYGMNYHNKLFQVGAAINRMISVLQNDQENSNPLGGYMTFYGTAFLKIRGGMDRLEPMVMYRQQMNSPAQIDVNLFYYNSKGIIVGASYRTENLAGISAGYMWNERVLLGYTYQMLIGDYSGTVGGSHELVLRYNFNKQYYEKSQKFKVRPRSSITTKKKGKGK
jgi:type IX secretion system PorP/SprF family membrane protein